jgi:hypothetical protein
MTLNIRDRLTYRRQFVLGPRPVSCIAGSKTTRIGSYYLTIHPDLNSVQVAEGNQSLTLLGYVLDPHDPQADDFAIVKRLLPELSAQPDKSLDRLNGCGGRWILIANNGSQITVLNDALGQRQVYYVSPSINGEAWCGSQPGIIADLLGLKLSRASMEFAEAQKKSGQQEYWFPNDVTPYDEIKLLLPNHFLDLTTAQPRRFWPKASLPRLSLKRAVREAADQLRGLMRCAANRFPMATLVTAGWDSRVVLAASKGLESEISYFTINLGTARTADADLDVPARLLPKLGKSHRVVEVAETMDPEIKEVFLRNVSAAHECWGAIAEALFRNLRQDEVRVTGSGSEAVRQQVRPTGFREITADTLASFAWTKEKFAVEEFVRWLADAPKELGFNLLDLFYWEQKCGQWLAIGQTEWDFAGESFTPFNCRALLATLLSTDEAYRVEPHYELYRALLKELWPEVLSEPVNPHKKPKAIGTSLRARVKDILVKSHMIELVR